MFSHLLHHITRTRTRSGAQPSSGRLIAPLVCLTLLLAPLLPTAPVTGQTEHTLSTASPASPLAASPTPVVLAAAHTTLTGTVVASRDEDPSDQWCQPDQRNRRSDSDHHDRDKKDKEDKKKDRKHKHKRDDDSDDDRDNWHSDTDTDSDSDRDRDSDRGVRTRAGTWRVRVGPVDLRVAVQCRPDSSFGRERGSSYYPGSYSPGGGWGRMRDEDRGDYDRDYDGDYDFDPRYDYNPGRGVGYGRGYPYGDRDTVAVRGRWECHALPSGGSGDRYGSSGTSVSYPGSYPGAYPAGWDRYGWNPTGTDFGWDGYRSDPGGWADPSSWNGTGPWGGPARMDWVSAPGAGASNSAGGCWLIRPRQDSSPLQLLGPDR